MKTLFTLLFLSLSLFATSYEDCIETKKIVLELMEETSDYNTNNQIISEYNTLIRLNHYWKELNICSSMYILPTAQELNTQKKELNK